MYKAVCVDLRETGGRFHSLPEIGRGLQPTPLVQCEEGTHRVNQTEFIVAE